MPDSNGKLAVSAGITNQPGFFQAPDNKLHLIAQLPQLALSMLICAARLELVHFSDLINFNMAYDEYLSMVSRSKIASSSSTTSMSSGRAWNSELAFNMWNYLVECELMLPLIGGAHMRKNVERTEMCRIDVSLEELRDLVAGIDPSLKDWCKI